MRLFFKDLNEAYETCSRAGSLQMFKYMDVWKNSYSFWINLLWINLTSWGDKYKLCYTKRQAGGPALCF